MKKLTPYQTFQDERGELVGLINQMHWEEFNYIESRAGSVRGNHYHKETQELFFIIEGEGRIEITTLAGESQSMPFGAGDIFLIDPNEVHTFYCETEAKWINALTKRFDPEHPDFHQLLATE